MEPEQNYHVWIRDAFSIEKHAEIALTELKQHLTLWPELREQVELHIYETQNNIAMLTEFMERRGITSSVCGKERPSHFQTCIQGINGLLMSREPVNNFVGSYLLEAYEIGCLTPMITAAEALGDQEAILLFDKIIQKDFNMVRWALEHLPEVTKHQLFPEKDQSALVSTELH
ncbi:DUF892 family protein [Erwinia billingiae]|jgi:ferritin-like metal-binding protein YciE|uniref:DUF892 family protein n=1 Tax=Erwinia billingiae TaxID=182337 RepID=UPI00069FE925|nr:DUF892 family protein [Erwinia billingiae]